MTKQAKSTIASQTKIATFAIKQMKTAVKANDMKTAVASAKSLVSAYDIANKAGLPKTSSSLKKFGFVKDVGGTWSLPIPANVLKSL